MGSSRVVKAMAAALLCAGAAAAVTVTFQQGAGGYAGFRDAEIRDPSINYDNGVYPREWPQRIAVVNTNY